MKRTTAIAVELCALAVLLPSSLLGQSKTKPTSSVALTHVTVIDSTGAPAQSDMTVILRDGRIAEIGKSAKLRAPKDARVVDATGKFLIPGLWDMHVHWQNADYLPLFLANGVTGMRIMWGLPVQHEWRRQVDAGELLAPHMVIASTIVDGPKPFWPGSISVSTEAEARQAVTISKETHADFVKVYSFLPREEYFAIVDEAKKQGIPFAGHVPLSVSAEEASNAGQRTFEHLFGILVATSARSDEIMQANRADLADEAGSEHPVFWGAHAKALRQVELDTYSPGKAAVLFALFKKNHTWQVPTLTLLRSIAYTDDPSFTTDARIKYMPRWAREMWTPTGAVNAFGPRTAEDMAFAKREYQKELDLVHAMQKAGVGILAGTDVTNPFCFPGFSLHDELGLMVKAGLTPMQALQTATLNPARFLGREKDFGTIEKGKIADLVLLDANPLDDIANTKKISAVVYGGALLPRAQLDQMLADVEAIAARQPVSEVMMKTIQEKDVASAIRQYRDLRAAQPKAYDFGENELISLGYQLLGDKKIADSIEVFKLSVETFPKSYNTWDSLADAYMDHGDQDLAIQNYKKSLELNPSNSNAMKKLKQLNAP